MAIYNGNNTYGNYSGLRQEDGKILGRIRVGIKPAYPTPGTQDYRFFVEPLSPLPRGYEESLRLGFTGFMSRVGYDCSFFSSEGEAWETLSKDWAQDFVTFTPALRNNKYFVLDDLQKEKKPEVLEEHPFFFQIPVFHVEEDPTFDGDIHKFAYHLGEGKPLPGLSRRYWDRRMLPQAVLASYKNQEGHRAYILFAPLRESAFQGITISEGGVYFTLSGKEDLGYRAIDLSQPDIARSIVLCHASPLCFIPQSMAGLLRAGLGAVPSDYHLPGIVPQPARKEEISLPQGSLPSYGRPYLRRGFVGREQSEMAKEAAPCAPSETRPATVQEEKKEEQKPSSPRYSEPVLTTPAAHESSQPARKEVGKEIRPLREELTEKAFLTRLKETARAKGLVYSENDLINFHISVKSSRLVILAGMSGTGKSGLVRLYGEALGLPKKQISLIPVKPSWMDDGDILGYVDMRNMIYRPADTGLADLLREADQNRDKLYIVCFDEMNLARAEHYFAQFISVLEKTGGDPVIRLYNPALAPRIYNSSDYPAEIPVGRNVIFTGTVNVDESTYHFSDKILDRANVITLTQGRFRDLKSLKRGAAPSYEEVKASVFAGFRRTASSISLSDSELDFLDALHDAMENGGLTGGIGYRTVVQMDNYLSNIPDGISFTRADGLDCQTVQRILTKLRGSAEQLKDLIDIDDKGSISGTVSDVLDKYSRLSSFQSSRAVLKRKAEELKAYDYTI